MQAPHVFLDLFFENSQLNVDAGEVDVRPPGAPTTAGRHGATVGTGHLVEIQLPSCVEG
jgi:hypothetical protein